MLSTYYQSKLEVNSEYWLASENPFSLNLTLCSQPDFTLPIGVKVSQIMPLPGTLLTVGLIGSSRRSC